MTQPTNTSTVQSQIKLRATKAKELKDMGHDPFTPNSQRDFKLGFIKFWFSFVHKFSWNEVFGDEAEVEYSELRDFLESVLFELSVEELEATKVMAINYSPNFDEVAWVKQGEQMNAARTLFEDLDQIKADIKYEMLEQFLLLEGEEIRQALAPNQVITLAGRIKSKRGSGKIAFATVEDESCPEGFQFIFKQDLLNGSNGQLKFEDFRALFDEGDYIQATGELNYSQSGEASLFVQEFKILTKALRPLPESLDYTNVEARYLDRVADFKMNTVDEDGVSVRDIIRAKSKYWQIWREEMIGEGFLEVECPIFEKTPGGADAKPFTTFYNELDQDMYLRISLELPLKQLIAGGFEKVFEIGRQFRNEGSDPTHLQEYTQIEWYWAYSNYYDAMPLTVRIYRRIASEILGKLSQIDYKGNYINWDSWITEEEARSHGWDYFDGWPAIAYYDAVRYFSRTHYKGGEIDLEGKNYDQLLNIAEGCGIEIPSGTSVSNLIDKIYKKVARPFMINPMFLILQPVELEPLAKRDPKHPDLVHRWQIIAGGEELGKCFSELNDPIDQLQRFEVQQKARDDGDEEAQFMNPDYVKALEYGLPPLSGFGMSERMVSFLLGKHIRECVTFPHIRSQEQTAAKSKETLVAHAILLDNETVPGWSKLNAAAHLSASLAARIGKKLIHLDSTETLDGQSILMNIQHAIMMKQTPNRLDLLKLKNEAEIQGLIVTCFTTEMRESSNDELVKSKQESKKAEDIGWLGILIFGPKKQVEKLTGRFELAD